MVTWLAFGVIAGGRLGWYFIYFRPNGQPTPWYEPFALWKGGMSFHGGLIGVILGLIIWSHFAKAPFWNLADCLAKVTPIGLGLGRVANFINAELVGRPTNLPWGVRFPIQMNPLVLESFPRHPSQLYEAILEGPILMAAVWLLGRRVENRPGVVAGWFMVLYGIFRFGVEFTRQPDPQLGFIAFGWLTMGQLLSILLALVGGVTFAVRWRKAPVSAAK
jgi:phosphatidylglycerol:prolipoprotein diacylglycerol transferase